MRIQFKTLFQVLLLSMIAFCAYAAATENPSSFEAFYKTGYSTSWAVSAVVAVLFGIAVFIGLPVIGATVTAVIGSIGSSIGGLFGLSGIAATNAGLALIGGGSIASGGFGVIGGTALLAAALTFGTEVTMDYGIGSVVTKFDSAKFSEASLKMMTLPLPVNSDSPSSVKAAGKALGDRRYKEVWECSKKRYTSYEDLKSCLTNLQAPQRDRVKDALAAMDRSRGETKNADKEREAAMYALLHFLNNDYVSAKKEGQKAYDLGIKTSHVPTLPSFIVAASLLYDDNPRIQESIKRFEYSISAEPKNPLTPVLFAAYLDRLSYRFNDRAVNVSQLGVLTDFSHSLENDKRKLAIQQSLLSHVVMQTKVAQQRVMSLALSENPAVRSNPHTLGVIKSSVADYQQLIRIGNRLLPRQEALLTKFETDQRWWKIVGNENKPPKELIAEWKSSIDTYRAALKAYERDHPRLRKIADSASSAKSQNVDTAKNGVVAPDKEKDQ